MELNINKHTSHHFLHTYNICGKIFDLIISTSTNVIEILICWAKPSGNISERTEENSGYDICNHGNLTTSKTTLIEMLLK